MGFGGKCSVVLGRAIWTLSHVREERVGKGELGTLRVELPPSNWEGVEKKGCWEEGVVQSVFAQGTGAAQGTSHSGEAMQ